MKPSAPALTAAEQLTLFAECEVVPQVDGSFKAIPRKPLVEVTVAQAAKIMSVSVDSVYRLFYADQIKGRRPTPRKILLDVDSLHAHKRATEDTEHWSEDRKKTFLRKK